MKQKLIVIVKGGCIQGIFSNIDSKVNIDIINYDVDTIDTEEEYRRKRLELELKTMIEI